MRLLGAGRGGDLRHLLWFRAVTSASNGSAPAVVGGSARRKTRPRPAHQTVPEPVSTRMAPTVVFDMDKVLLGGDASTLFLHGRLRQAPAGCSRCCWPCRCSRSSPPAPAASPGARLMTRIAVGGRAEDDVQQVAAAYREALTRKPEAAVAEAIAAVRAHQQRGDLVVVATGCEETLARSFLTAIGLGDLDVVGSRAVPPRHALGEAKVALLTERGYPPVGGGLQRQRLRPAAVRRHPAAGPGQRRREGGEAGRADAGPLSGDDHLALSPDPANTNVSLGRWGSSGSSRTAPAAGAPGRRPRCPSS